jgi:alpha-ribazole phosphatase/probable phosphoglycerate mutase
MSTDTVTTVDLLRHGEPEGGVRYRGSVDDPLSKTGWKQMRTAVGDHCPWDVIVSSPLRRCAEFAQELSRRHELPLSIAPGFREISFGDWEGHTADEIMTANPEALSLFWRDPLRHPPPNGEPLLACNRRVTAAWRDLLQLQSDRHVLLVAHGGIIRIVLRQVLEMPLKRLWRLEVPYATFSRVRVYRNGSLPEPLLEFHGKGLE